jgi:hypothetical protein
VQATVGEGVLEIRIPKHAQQERSRRIEVRGADAGGGQALTASVAGGPGAGSAASTAQGRPTAAPAGETAGTR